MNSSSILQPALALMLLTFIVWVYMYVLRLHYIISHKVPAQSVSSPELLNSILPEHINRPSNNLKNLFELPVIFYAVCVFLFAVENTEQLSITLAWVYVSLRTIHSILHCTVNWVLPRFIVYILSSVIPEDSGISFHTAPAGSTFVIPQGCWHRLNAGENLKMLYFTPGQSLHCADDMPPDA